MLTSLTFPLLLFSFLTLTLIYNSSGETLDQNFLRSKKEKLTYLRFYWHDILNGTNPTSIPIIAPQKNYAATAFGQISMIDNPLTVGPTLSSKLVGRSQGFYAGASKEEFGLLMGMNLVFVDGKYNGSTITVFGRNAIFEKVREMPVIGGTGVFRLARGYVEVRTTEFDAKTNNAVVEYNCYILHY